MMMVGGVCTWMEEGERLLSRRIPCMRRALNEEM